MYKNIVHKKTTMFNTCLSEDHGNELLIVDIPIPVYVCLGHELLGLLLGEHLPDVHHDGRQLRRGDEAVALLVKHAEGFSDLLLNVRVVKLSSEHHVY